MFLLKSSCERHGSARGAHLTRATILWSRWRRQHGLLPVENAGGPAADGAATESLLGLSRYRDPRNPEQTWSGIGRTPRWVQAILDERGIDMNSFKAIPMYRLHDEG